MRSVNVVALLVVVCFAFAIAQNQQASTDDVTVQFVGSSGKIKLFPSNDSNSFIMVSQSKLTEMTPSGNKVSANSVNFVSEHLSWSAVTKTTNGSTTYYSTTYGGSSQSFSLGSATVTFSLTANLYQTSAVVPYGNSSVNVVSNSLKFSVSITGWPFNSNNNYLSYDITVEDKGGDQDGSLETVDNGQRVHLDGGYIEVPTTAIIDGVTKNINVTYTTVGQSTINFEFPHFSQSLYYDPTIVMDGMSGSNSNAAISVVPSILLLQLLAVLVVFWN